MGRNGNTPKHQMQQITIRQLVSIVNSSTIEARPSKYSPKSRRERLIKPDSEQVRWLHNEVSNFTMEAVNLVGSQAELARQTKIHSTTVMRMLNGELPNVRVLGLICNKLNLKISLKPK